MSCAHMGVFLVRTGGVSCVHMGSILCHLLCTQGECLLYAQGRFYSIVCTGECLHVLCAQAKIVLASVCPHIHASQSWEEQMVTLQQMTFDIM